MVYLELLEKGEGMHAHTRVIFLTSFDIQHTATSLNCNKHNDYTNTVYFSCSIFNIFLDKLC